jgi:hypothetical protein
MDQNKKSGTPWQTMTASAKVDTLRRVRDSKALSAGRDEFVKNILDEGLEAEWVRQMSENNLYDR